MQAEARQTKDVVRMGCTAADALRLEHECCVHAAGEPGKDKKKVWVIARQHPGESMAGQRDSCFPLTAVPGQHSLLEGADDQTVLRLLPIMLDLHELHFDLHLKQQVQWRGKPCMGV